MTDNWDRTIFDKDLKAILETKLPVSASKITGLQALATAHPKHHNYIVQCITRFIETAPPDYRLAGLYVIDAISRVVHKQQRKREENNEGPTEADGYLKRFAIVLKEDSLIGCFEPCTAKDKEKVKKTLDFWEQGNVYSKDVVQYVKKSFLNNGSMLKERKQEEENKGTPPVDTALLLATLSNIGNGTLSNLNIPGLSSTPPPPPPAPIVSNTPEVPEVLPPALAKLLGGLVSTPPPSIPTNVPVTDPRMRTNSNIDPRQRSTNWPVPQGPSIPSTTTNSRPTERKSRWGSANETTTSQPQQDPWLQRQSIQDPRLAMNNNNSYQPPPTNMNNNSYQPPLANMNNNSYQPPPPSNMMNRAPYQAPSYQPQQQQPYSYQQQSSYQPMQTKGAEPIHDPSIPSGCIKVLTRTLFVGPIPDHYEKEDVGHLFSKYGELASVIVSKKLKGRHNAFLKFTTRGSTEAAKYGSSGLVVEDVPVKVNWAFGFGPKKHFNYDRGDSIIPLIELSPDEKDNLMTAPVGGFQGQQVRELMTVEEPEAQYRPEWKNNNDTAGFKRQGPSGANFEEINNTRKRSRFNNDNNSPPHSNYQQQNFYQQPVSTFNNNHNNHQQQ